jgi:galactose mutarotase-like enzyme
MIELRNDVLAIRVAEMGAELQSVKDSEGREYMWQAGEQWPRHSPILFPIVCSVNNNTYVVDGKEYHLPRHGFARDTEFTVISQTEFKDKPLMNHLQPGASFMSRYTITIG